MTTPLRVALDQSGQTAVGLAERTNTARSAVYNYLNGDRDPPATFIAKAAPFLGVSVGELLGVNPAPLRAMSDADYVVGLSSAIKELVDTNVRMANVIRDIFDTLGGADSRREHLAYNYALAELRRQGVIK